MHYLVGYLDSGRGYNSKIVSIDSPLNASCKAIPGFKQLVDNVVAKVGSADPTVIEYNLELIGVISYDISEIEDRVKRIDLKTQVVAISYIDETGKEQLVLKILGEQTRLDALYEAVRELNLPCNPEVLDTQWDSTSLNYVMTNLPVDNSWQVHEVSTLKRLIRAMIEDA